MDHFATVGHLKCTVKAVLIKSWRPNGCLLEPPRTPPAYGSDIDPSGLGQTAAATPAIAAIIYCQELNALPPGTSLISPVDGVDLSTSSPPGSDAYGPDSD